jgi:hypothetical protein
MCLDASISGSQCGNDPEAAPDVGGASAIAGTPEKRITVKSASIFTEGCIGIEHRVIQEP